MSRYVQKAELEERFLTTKEVASRYGLTEGTLRNWRWSGRGPLAVKVGRSVRYRLSDLHAWENQHTTSSTSEVVK